mmetsp:Transcript_105868/g.297673  ORF Transcript_105868/g.297673 Transcript_105868/m.297673 type:complete len:142 (+) Transcript_105868:157-582(+)
MFAREVVVPVRFLASAGQLLGTISVYLDPEPHILAGLPTRYSLSHYHDAHADFTRVLVLSMAGLLLELGSLLAGFSFFSDYANNWHCLLHGAGCVAVTAFSIFSANFGYFWQIFCVAGALPLLLEAASLYVTFGMRRVAYS